MPGILGVGQQYARSAQTGAITGAGNAQARSDARQSLSLKERELEISKRFAERKLKMEREAAQSRMRSGAGAMIGGVIGAYYGQGTGFLVGSSIGGFIGGLF